MKCQKGFFGSNSKIKKNRTLIIISHEKKILKYVIKFSLENKNFKKINLHFFKFIYFNITNSYSQIFD